MIRTINQGNFYINDRETSHYTVVSCFQCTLANSRDIFAGNNTAFDCIDKFKAFASFLRLDLKPYMAILTTTTRLTNKFAFDFNFFGDCFTIGNLWLTNICFNFEFAL